MGALQTVARCSHVIAALRSLGRHLLPPLLPARHPVQMVRAAFRGDTGEPLGRAGSGAVRVTGGSPERLGRGGQTP